MEINGNKLQEEILDKLQEEIKTLNQKGIEPCIAIVTLGPEDSWEVYVNRKLNLAKKIGIKAKLINIRPKTTEEVIEIVENLNNDRSIHGLIVQRPFPKGIDTERVVQSVAKAKDIDGFLTNSGFDVPAWLATKYILAYISSLLNFSDLRYLLSNKSILVVGKGGTAGKPVIEGLRKIGFEPNIIDSKTSNRNELFKNADIIISAVGKKGIIPVNLLREKSILIGIGVHGEDGKLTGDFDQTEAREKDIIYTPTPGGVGPVNLAFLFKNLIRATTNQA